MTTFQFLNPLFLLILIVALPAAFVGSMRLFKEATPWMKFSGQSITALAVTALVLALAGPQIRYTFSHVEPVPAQIIELGDNSGSVTRCIPDSKGALQANQSQILDDFCPRNGEASISIRDAMREQMLHFVQMRGQDKVGITIFSDKPEVVSALGASYDSAVSKLKTMDMVAAGTDLNAAFQSAVDQLKQVAGERRVIILMSDGEDDITLDKLVNISVAVRDEKIALYWVRPALESISAPSDAVTSLIKAAGGKVFDVSTRAEVALAMDQINALEAPATKVVTDTQTLELRPVLGFFFVVLLMAWVFHVGRYIYARAFAGLNYLS